MSLFAGGGILALSLVPQVIKLLLTRSAADISLLWSLLYLLGEHEGALAAQHAVCCRRFVQLYCNASSSL
jgi:hypothetical protein